MNHWTELSIRYANTRSYLDDLFRVYPLAPGGLREIDEECWERVEAAFKRKDNVELLKNVLNCSKVFPVKDSYVPYLRQDPGAIDRNPATVQRLCGRLYELNLKGTYDGCSAPIETNQQIGALFGRWVRSGVLGVPLLTAEAFAANKGNAVLEGGDAELVQFARTRLGYSRDKGLDFVGRFNKKYVIGEAKFVTDKGGNQDKSMDDVIAVVSDANVDAVAIGIVDGVVYIPPKIKSKAFTLFNAHPEHHIMSALVLREFLFSL